MRQFTADDIPINLKLSAADTAPANTLAKIHLKIAVNRNTPINQLLKPLKVEPLQLKIFKLQLDSLTQ